MTYTNALKTFILILSCSFLTAACSSYMAANQPGKLDLDLFQSGTPKSLLIAEFGRPAQEQVEEDGVKYDIYVFNQGYSTVEKTGRVLIHGVADIATLGLWEVVGTPIEAARSGQKMAVKVSYDESNLVEKVFFLKRKYG